MKGENLPEAGLQVSASICLWYVGNTGGDAEEVAPEIAKAPTNIMESAKNSVGLYGNDPDQKVRLPIYGLSKTVTK